MNVTLREELDLRRAPNLVKAAAIGLLFVATYAPTLVALHERYSEVDSYYGHGYLIPLACGVIVWLKRETLKRLAVTPWGPGLGVLTAGLLLYLFARWWYVNFAAALSLIVVLAGLCLYLFGTTVTRALAFPLAFLLFMIPLPTLAIIYVTFWLKLVASAAAAQVVSALGIPVLVEGAFIVLPNARLEVDNACSGLRSLIALTAIGILFTYLVPISRLGKALVAIAAVPIAVVANGIRIVILIVISYRYGPTGRAFEVTDFTTGYLIFLVAFACLYLASAGVRAWEARGAR